MNIFLLLQAIISILLVLSILLQHRAAGLTAGGSGMNTMVAQRRGAEKVLFQSSIVLTIAFFVVAVAQWYLV
jgi:protein translocase SecG subunit